MQDCRNIGYSGRMALYEVFSVKPRFADGDRRRDGDQIRKHAADSGNGEPPRVRLSPRVQGHTTVEEVLSVVADQGIGRHHAGLRIRRVADASGALSRGRAEPRTQGC